MQLWNFAFLCQVRRNQHLRSFTTSCSGKVIRVDVEMIVLTILSSIFTYFFVCYIVEICRHYKPGAIPGPFPLPVIGNLHLIRPKYVHMDIASLSDAYGEVYAIYFGSEKFLVATGAKSVRELLIEKGTHFAGRPTGNPKVDIATLGCQDVVAGDYGPRFKFMKKLFARGLNLFDKQSMKSIAVKHANTTIAYLETSNSPDPRKNVNLGVANIIMHIVFSAKLEFEDPIFENILNALRLIFSSAIKPGLEDLISWFKYFPTKNITDMKEGVRKRDEILEKFIKEHRETYQEGIIRDITDAMIAAEAEELRNGGGKLDHDNFTMIIMDIFFAGIDTTSGTILWILLYLAKYPEIQAKLRKELELVEDLDPDKATLPYTRACIFEGYRLGNGSILTHKATRDTSIRGFSVEKDTPVFVNFHGAFRDKSVFQNPNIYIPERWINEKGEYAPNTSVFLPFGGGPRVCPGRHLASMVVFIFITRIVKHFKLEEISGHENSLESEFGLSIPPPRNLKIKMSKV